MFTPIHRVLGQAPGPLDSALIDRAIEQRVEEATDLEFKAEVYPAQNQVWRAEAAKDIAAMANAGGGWFLFGITDDDDEAASAPGVSWSDGEAQRLRDVAYNLIAPPVVGVEFHPIPRGGADPVVAMRIPSTSERPHFARSKKVEEGLVAPLRNGPHTVFMSEAQIADQYRQRFQRARERREELEEAYRATADWLDRENGVCLVFEAIPREYRSGQRLAEIAASAVYAKRPLRLLLRGDYATQSGHPAEVHRGLRGWVLRLRTNNVMPPYRIGLHDDGAMSSCHRLSGLADHQGDSEVAPRGERDQCLSTDVEYYLAQNIAVLRNLAEHLNVTGGYSLRVGLVGPDGAPIMVRDSIPGFASLVPEDQREWVKNFRPLTVEFDPLAAEGQLLAQTRTLAADLINQSGAQHLKALLPLDESDTPVTS
ncbi:AlbA family DNA-binding domain-containing protein [Bogoriella caseilytica]|uniref:Putative DNA-binding protein n=1 Tax=Bogoriella caseilytica TaxID=56055 RepID=A0A3N2BGS9_9MICO|nr:ATP-binding protein [Bogoriella caseilytica]ROR74428.1 putative DNA-binding protein [Bogoriella caseilytica]